MYSRGPGRQNSHFWGPTIVRATQIQVILFPSIRSYSDLRIYLSPSIHGAFDKSDRRGKLSETIPSSHLTLFQKDACCPQKNYSRKKKPVPWLKHLPKCSMYGLFTYIWVVLVVHVGKYTIHWASGLFCISYTRIQKFDPCCKGWRISELKHLSCELLFPSKFQLHDSVGKKDLL